MTAPVHVGRLNEQAKGSVDRALEYEQQLATVYAGQLRRAGRHASARFRELAPIRMAAVTAAVNPKPPDWAPPDHDELQDEPLNARAQAKAKRIHLAAAAAAVPAVLQPQLDDRGIAFDLGSPFADTVLAKVGTKGVNLGLATRDVIVKVIGQAYSEGWTVTKTAAALQENIDHLSTTTAVMQARTDLVGLANGASIAAVQALSDNAPPVKIWVATEDERTRETHADADGQEVPIDQPFQVGDDLLNYPGDPDGSTEETANCRCTVIFSDTATPSDGQVDEEALAASADGPDVSALAMVAVYPRPEEAATLAINGGQDADKMHCTLVFLGEADSFDHDMLAAAVRGVADALPPLEGTVGGAGHFAEGPDGYPSILIPDVQGLSTLQESLRSALAAAGIVSPSEHGFTPHMTQSYSESPDPPDVGHLGKPLHFDSVSISYADVRTDYPLAAAAVPSLSSGRPTVGVASVTVDTSPESLTAGVTITVDDEPDTDDMAAADAVRWRAILCVEGEPSQDGPSLVRTLQPGGGSWRDLPLPLGVMFETPHADDVTAVVCGRIDQIYRDSIDNRVIWGEGVFNPDEIGSQAAEYVGNLSLRGVSIDPYVADLAVTELEAPTDEAPMGKTLMTFVDYVIGGATICPFQALESATIAIIASGDGGDDAHVITPTWFIRGPLPEPVADDALVAAATVKAAPREWFETQEPPGLMPLTVTDDGRMFGHLASWDVCHTAFAEACVRPPRSASNYGYFHVGEVETADGPVAVGKLMVAKPGRAGKHASLNASRAEASRHYDDNTAVGAYIRVVDGRHGPWAAGVVRPGLDEDSLAQLRANPPSGDWRRVNGSLELIAALSVPVPGFPVPRADAALVASGETVEVDALIACSGELVETPAVRKALERAGVVDREGPEPTVAQITAKAARAQGRDALVAAALGENR